MSHVHEHVVGDGQAAQRLSHRTVLVGDDVERVVAVSAGIVNGIRRPRLAHELGSAGGVGPVRRQLVVGGVKDLFGVVGRRLHEVGAWVVPVDQLLGFGKLDTGWTEVVEATFDEEPVFLVVVQQVVPKLLLESTKIRLKVFRH